MSAGLLSQLRSYYESVDEDQDPIRPEEVSGLLESARESPLSEVPMGDGHVRPLRSLPTRGGMQRRWVIAAAAAAVVLVVAAPVLLLLERAGSDSPVATAPESTSLLSLTWSRVPQTEAVFSGEGNTGIGSVTVGGPGLVAVGGDANGGAVWTSANGVTWSRVPHDEAVFGGENVTMVGVTAGGPGLVAVGWEGDTFADTPPYADAAVWTSVDGITWSRVPHNEDIFGAAFMTRVTAGGPGLVAVGMDGPWDDGDAAIWTSGDGLTWTRVPHNEAVFGGVDSQVIYDVTVGGPGLVAVGSDGGRGWWDNNPENRPAVWTSVDGVNWSRVPDDEAAFGRGGNPVMLGVTAGGPGLVAVGADWWPPGEAITPIWTSPDGINWTRVPHDTTVSAVSLTSVTAGGAALVAVGESDADRNGVWTSVDGISWVQVPHDEAVFGRWPDWVSDVTVFGEGFVAVGYHNEDGAIWLTEK